MASALAGIPFDPQRGRGAGDVLREAASGIEFVAHNLPRAHRVLSRLHPYPRPWRQLEVEGAQGARLAAWHGPGAPGGPAIVVVPGTFQTKDDAARRRRALDLWRRFGAHVLIVDMRGFGGSAMHYNTVGWLEPLDVLAASERLLEESGAARAVAWGESLGGAVALLAGCIDGAERRLERVVAWSAFTDLLDATLAGSRTHARGRTMLGRTYRWLLKHRTGRAIDFGDYVAWLAAQRGVDADEVLRRGSPLHRLAELRVPAVELHAEDDPVVPVEHARRLQDAAHPLVDVHIVPRGRHLTFDVIAPAWYRAVTEAVVRGPVGV